MYDRPPQTNTVLLMRMSVLSSHRRGQQVLNGVPDRQRGRLVVAATDPEPEIAVLGGRDRDRPVVLKLIVEPLHAWLTGAGFLTAVIAGEHRLLARMRILESHVLSIRAINSSIASRFARSSVR